MGSLGKQVRADSDLGRSVMVAAYTSYMCTPFRVSAENHSLSCNRVSLPFFRCCAFDIARNEVSSQSSEWDLPSGKQEENMWQDLQEYLFGSSGAGIKKMKRSEYHSRKDFGNLEDVVEDVGVVSSVASPGPPRQKTGSARNSGSENNPESPSAEGGTGRSDTRPEDVQGNAGLHGANIAPFRNTSCA